MKKNNLHFKKLAEIEDYVDVIGDIEEVYNENEKDVT